MRTPTDAPLSTPVTALNGVGPERAARLARLELRTVEDLLLHRPHRYEDRRQMRTISELPLGQPGTTRGRIVAQGIKTYRHRSRSVFEFVLEDGSGRLHCRWWNLPFLEKQFAVGDDVMVSGRLLPSRPRTMDHPDSEVLEPGEETRAHLDRIVPFYPLTEGLTQRWLRGLIWRTLEQYGAAISEPWPGLAIPDFFTRAQAIRQLHDPAGLTEAEQARQRLALDEFIELQLGIQSRRRHLETHATARRCAGDNRLIKPFLRQLGFTLTAAQTRVLREVRRDLGGPHPMRRLVQGDVGSGKTAVAACAVLMAIESGFNAALMGPTQIVAEQHFQTFLGWFKPLGVGVELQTGSRKTWAQDPRGDGRRRDARAEPGDGADAAASGPGILFVGTHALIEAAFQMPRLGLVVIDEQHRFGVVQREELLRKGRYPHLLVMTATPIPRTLGLTLYGDLDVSVIDELPAGRGRVRTFVRSASQLPRVYAFLQRQVADGHQVYMVYPRIDEEDASTGLKAVTREWERLQPLLAPARVGLLHGRLAVEESDRVMSAFRRGQIDVLLATSVIEVGVDIPNATVMIIQNAERYGLAQLHQLRGRVGRGARESQCILVADRLTADARRRLEVLVSSDDGFAIAEADLGLRGPGELLGQSQSGLPPLRFGELAGDGALVERARALAADLLKSTPSSDPRRL